LKALPRPAMLRKGWMRRRRDVARSLAAMRPDPSRPASRGFQECGQFADVADEHGTGREFFSRTQALGADERGAHAVRDRRGNVAGEVVADEQHLAGGASGSDDDQIVEDLLRFTC
jgi:hypothetical protein